MNFYIDRIIKRYGIKPTVKGWAGKPYNDLIGHVITENNVKIANRITEISRDKWSKALGKIGTKEKRFVIPDVSDVLPKRSVFIKKSAESGKLISDTLRKSLTDNLRDAMTQFTETTREATYLRRRGALAGTINPKLIKQFSDNITNTFVNYTKKDPSIGVPTNIRNISVTEVRSTINQVKHAYVNNLVQKNPDIVMKKTWIQNRSMSKEYRRGHSVVNGHTLHLSQAFQVPVFKKFGKRWIRTGQVISMDHPHCEDAPPGEAIGCSCEIEYTAQRIK